MRKSNFTRRDLIRATGVAGATALPASALRASAAGRLRLGVIGAGNRGREVLRTIRAAGLPCDCLAICDIVDGHARKAVEAAGGSPEVYTDYTALLARDDLDAVVVATPNFLHCEMVVAALERNLHVLCEKPMARNTAECDLMIRAWRSGGRVLAVGLQNRYHPLHAKIRELIQAGAVGDVRHIAATEFRRDWKRITPGSTAVSRLNWRYFDSLSGGSLVEKHCHDFDLFAHWMQCDAGAVCGMGGTGYYDNRDSLDHASVVVNYDNGCTVSMDFNIGVKGGKGFHEWTLVGTQGQMSFRRKGTELLLTTWAPESKTERITIDLDGRESGHNGTLPLVTEFVKAARGEAADLPTPLDGRRSVRICEAGERAIRERRVVATSEVG